jgi:hypothetical protein
MKTYTLHRLDLFSLFKFGFFSGLIASLPPICILTLLAWSIVVSMAKWLGNLTYTIPIPFPGISGISVDGVELLHARDLLTILEVWAALSWLRGMLLVVGLTFAAGLWMGLTAVISGLAFNLLAALSGGLQMTLSERVLQVLPGLPVPEGAAVPGIPVPQPQQTGPRLEINSPIQRIVPITREVTLIGSGPECDLSLDDLQTRHAQLSYENGRYILRDFSQGKSQVQGHIVQGMNMVRDGFVLQLGQYTMTFWV